MKPRYKSFSFKESLASIEKTIDKENNFVLERDNLPDSSDEMDGKVIFAYCSVIYIDLQMKQDLTDLTKRIIYGKEYQSIITQVCALLSARGYVKNLNMTPLDDCYVWTKDNKAEDLPF